MLPPGDGEAIGELGERAVRSRSLAGRLTGARWPWAAITAIARAGHALCPLLVADGQVSEELLTMGEVYGETEDTERCGIYSIQKWCSLSALFNRFCVFGGENLNARSL